MNNTLQAAPRAVLVTLKAVSDNATRNSQIVVLADGYTVPQTFYDRIQQQVSKMLPILKRSKALKSNELCGQEFWDQLDDGDRRIAGRCITHMVAKHDLPLVFIEGKHEYPKWYRVKTRSEISGCD